MMIEHAFATSLPEMRGQHTLQGRGSKTRQRIRRMIEGDPRCQRRCRGPSQEAEPVEVAGNQRATDVVNDGEGETLAHLRRHMKSHDSSDNRGRPVCVYDTGCSICHKLARWASRRSDITFTGPIDLRHRGVDQAEYVEYVVYAGETVERGHRAIGAVLMTMEWPWTWVGRFINFKPVGPLAHWVYRFVAKNRSRLPRWLTK